MAYVINGDCCIACGVCEGACPTSAISANAEDIRVIDAGACIDCGACAGTCPADCIAQG